MELYFLRPIEYQKLYNCNLYNIDQVPLNQRQHIVPGVIFMALSIIFMPPVSYNFQVILLNKSFLVFWITESSTAVVLALSRCCEVISPNISSMLFHGNKTWLWIAFTFLYGFSFVTFTKPSVFSGVLVAWFLILMWVILKTWRIYI
uniref:Uncharacterized protein n=1 Tax=Ditylenchus dipsaci TaxID=166011 RepID=A0A915CNG7_9BILA